MSTPYPSVPADLATAISADWLGHALRPVLNGHEIAGVRVVETLRTLATKIRLELDCPGAPAAVRHICLKGFFDLDPLMERVAGISLLEADFYTKLAPELQTRIPDCLYAAKDDSLGRGVVIMSDLIAQGGRFLSALDTLDADQAAASLAQLASLHASRVGNAALDQLPWVRSQIATLDPYAYISTEELQGMLDGPRGEGLPADVRSAANLQEGLGRLARISARWEQVLLHGDAHAGNIFVMPEGPGLIDWQLLQRGGWALDVAYHINAVLPVAVAEREERALLDDYLTRMRHHGADLPQGDEAFTQYRLAATYGYYLWAITRRVDPAVTNVFVNRLGSAVTRHDSLNAAKLVEV